DQRCKGSSTQSWGVFGPACIVVNAEFTGQRYVTKEACEQSLKKNPGESCSNNAQCKSGSCKADTTPGAATTFTCAPYEQNPVYAIIENGDTCSTDTQCKSLYCATVPVTDNDGNLLNPPS